MKSVRILNKNGCRIYSTGSFFINGGLASIALDGGNDHNIQLVSSRSIALGLGNTLKPSGTVTCEARGFYEEHFVAGRPRGRNSFFARYAENQGGSHTRAFGVDAAAKTFLDQIYAEGVALGTDDAACEPAGRGQALSRLLLLAPRVDSRYNGNFSGSVISEAPVMSVGSFKFSFDPVFERVPILPLTPESQYLIIEE